ncbi:MAG: archaellin/type IV pilin N-terminal domain-containing protein [Desulfurococcaceae archaeon]
MPRIKNKKMKGIVGIEAAIVLIAFVIVAAALAFVVINMGMYTTQKSKEVMQQGLNEASTALEVDGTVLGYVDEGTVVTHIYIPLKVSPGMLAVDFNHTKIDISIILPTGAYSKINSGNDPESRTDDVVDLKQLQEQQTPTTPIAKIYIIQGDDDTVLEVGEKFMLVIALNEGLTQYQSFTVEIRPLQGAPLVIERTVPPTLTVGQFVSLG